MPPLRSGHDGEPSRADRRVSTSSGAHPYARPSAVSNEAPRYRATARYDSHHAPTVDKYPSTSRAGTNTGHRAARSTEVSREDYDHRTGDHPRTSSSRTLHTSSDSASHPTTRLSSKSSRLRETINAPPDDYYYPYAVPAPHPDDERMPSVEMLEESARRLITPSVLWPEIDSFIEHLVQIEIYRMHAVKEAKTIFYDAFVELDSQQRPMNQKGKGRADGRDAQDNQSDSGVDIDELKRVVADALKPNEHEASREKYKSIVFAAKRSALIRRMKRTCYPEAAHAFNMYWPRLDDSFESTPRDTPHTFMLSAMSSEEQAAFETEADSVANELNKCFAWIRDCQRKHGTGADFRKLILDSDIQAAFDTEFPSAISKTWIGPACTWMEDVCRRVGRIRELVGIVNGVVQDER